VSITDGGDELNQAVQRVAAMTDEALARDLAYWSLAARDAEVAYQDLSERRARAKAQYDEARAHGVLITDQMRYRRDKGRARRLIEGEAMHDDRAGE
jgi:hypothetical protein